MDSRSISEWHYPSMHEEWQLYQAGRGNLAYLSTKGIVEYASNSRNLVAYEVRPAAKAIVCRAIIGLDGAPIEEQAVLEFLKREGEVFSCPTLIKDESIHRH